MSELKTCSRCKEEKLYIFFGKDKNRKDGLNISCKGCLKIFRNENSKKYSEARRLKYAYNIIEERKKRRERIKTPDYKLKRKEYLKQYKEKYPNNKSISDKKYNLKNSEKIKLNKKIYALNNKDIIKIKQREYHLKNKESVNKTKRIYQKKKLESDPLFKLNRNLSHRVRQSLTNKGYVKNKQTEKLIGCSIIEAKIYIESLFLKGMDWNNRNKWHIDHIIPLSSANTKEELINLFHYTNLQPLWAKDNLMKSNKIIEKQLKLI